MATFFNGLLDKIERSKPRESSFGSWLDQLRGGENKKDNSFGSWFDQFGLNKKDNSAGSWWDRFGFDKNQSMRERYKADALKDKLAMNKGRYGDTTLREVGGEVSHVNPQEAYAIDNYGLAGELETQAQGAGTINPHTGLREYHGHSLLGVEVATAENSMRHYHELQPDGVTYVERAIDRTHPGWDYAKSDSKYHTEQEVLDSGEPGYDFGTMREFGIETPEFSSEALRQFIDPETNEIIEGQEAAYIQFMRLYNPEYNRKDTKGNPLYTDADILRAHRENAPGAFADPEEKKISRTGYEAEVAGLRGQAYQDRLAAQKAGGSVFRPGQDMFGGADKKIGEALHQGVAGQTQKYGEDIYGLGKEATDLYEDYVLGATNPESEWY